MTKRFAFLLVILFSIALTPSLYSDDSDLYTPTLRNQKAASGDALQSQNLYRWTLGLPALPFDILKFILDPTAYYVEESHLVKKIDWAWKEIKRRGFYPEARFSPTTLGSGIGVKAELDEIFKTNEKMPNLKYDALVGYAVGGFFDASAGYKISLPNDPAVYQQTRVKYEETPLLSFYGIGNKSNRGELSYYSQEEMSIDSRFGYKAGSFTTEPYFRYRHVNIGNGELEGQFRLKEHFTDSQAPGRDGANLINLGFDLTHDTRDSEEDPLKGGYEKFNFHYTKDTEGLNFDYLSMSLNAAHFWQIWSDRRVFALHMYAGRTQRLGDSQIPFFDLQKLGGYGIQPTGSEMLRSYSFNRFMDRSALVITPEYRYNIWKYGSFAADSVFFTDIGEVFHEVHDFGVNKLKVSYGGGLRFKKARDVFLSLEIAHGNEGTAYYARTKAPF